VQAMAWWLVPITATLLAIAWVTWSARPRRPADPHDTLAAHRRFTEALSPTTTEDVAGESSVANAPDAAANPSSREHRRTA
jgi:hypothetical protein